MRGSLKGLHRTFWQALGIVSLVVVVLFLLLGILPDTTVASDQLRLRSLCEQIAYRDLDVKEATELFRHLEVKVETTEEGAVEIWAREDPAPLSIFSARAGAHLRFRDGKLEKYWVYAMGAGL